MLFDRNVNISSFYGQKCGFDCCICQSRKLIPFFFRLKKAYHFKTYKCINRSTQKKKLINCCASIRKSFKMSFKFGQKSYAGNLYIKFNWKIITTWVCVCFVCAKALFVFTLIKMRYYFKWLNTQVQWLCCRCGKSSVHTTTQFGWIEFLEHFFLCVVVVWFFDPSI